MTDIQHEASRCLHCSVPLCQTGCPLGNHIRDFVALVEQGNYEEAGKVLYAQNPFPELTTALCNRSHQCQGACIRERFQEHVEIAEIEAEIAKSAKRDLSVAPKNGHSIGLVGAGPANLAAAFYLLSRGYSVTIYERDARIGGALNYGIPDFRLDKTLLDSIQADLTQMGADFRFDTTIGKEKMLSPLLARHERMLISVGAISESRKGLSAKSGVVSGLSFLRAVNLNGKQEDYKKYRSAIVFGGGNVAFACARSLIRIMPDVTVVYWKTERDMAANDEEIAAARKEGVKIEALTNIKELVLNEEGAVSSAKMFRTQASSKDEGGKISFTEVKNTEFGRITDLVIVAAGRKVDLASVAAGLQRTEGHHTSMKGVYLSGDACFGPKNVAFAIKDGLAVAREIVASF